jgi:putative transposase
MPRRARIRLPNVPVHVVQRAINKAPCFFRNDDRRFYLDQLEELAGLFECAVHAYVLMSNHIHLLVTPEREPSLSLLMKHLNQRYVQRLNRIYRRTGALWEGRYRGSFVDREFYLLCCYRYIELNPVRAGMVRHPRNYPWSSYRINAEGMHSPLIEPHPVFQALADDATERREAYRRLFDSELEPRLVDEIRTRTNGNFAIGNDEFVRRAEVIVGKRLSPRRQLHVVERSVPERARSGTSP